MKNRTFQASETKAIGGLTLLYSIRMLGLFMVLPIMALYSDQLDFATPTTVGLALGIYGLSQAILQIPFGMLSDRWGRKPIIVLGLLLMMLGSVIAAHSTSIYGVIIGRAVQGSGAISGAIMALLADHTREEVRTPAMAFIGINIGMSIGASMVIGPIISHYHGLEGVFITTAFMALAGLAVIWRLVPSTSVRSHQDVGMDWGQFARILKRSDLARLDLSIFALHCIFTALFVVLPLELKSFGFSSEQAGWIYLPIMISSFVAMTPMIIIAEKYRHLRPVFLGTVVLLIATFVLMYLLPSHVWGIIILLWCFFFAFNLMEAMLPSMISKAAPAGGKGTALGIYSTSQFLGTTAGGALGGVISHHFGLDAVFLLLALIALVWLAGVWKMPAPRHLSSEIVSINQSEHSQQQLMNAMLDVPGVIEVMVVEKEQVAYLKIDRKIFDRDALNALLQPAG